MRFLQLEVSLMAASKPMTIWVDFNDFVPNTTYPDLMHQPIFQAFYAFSFVDPEFINMHFKRIIENGACSYNQLLEIDETFAKSLEMLGGIAVPPTLQNYGAKAKYSIPQGEVKINWTSNKLQTAYGADINTLVIDKLNLVLDVDGFVHTFTFPTEKFAAVADDYEYRKPNIEDARIMAASFQVGP